MLDNHILSAVIDPATNAELGDYYCDMITAEDLVTWRDQQAARLIYTIDPNSDRDPTRRLEALREPRGPAKSLSTDELRALLEAAQTTTPEWYAFFCLLAFTGLRFGEATALKWLDIDEQQGAIWVRDAQWKGHIDDTKTGKVRSIPLMPVLTEILAMHWVAQREAVRTRLKRQNVTDINAIADAMPKLVFPSRQLHTLMHNTAPAKPLRAALDAAGITRRFTVHGFRHTFNNLVRQAADGASQGIVLRAMTGHSSVEMTEHYSDVPLHEKRKAVGSLLRLVSA